MLRFFPFLLLLFPALELWVLIQVGSRIGALSTIALVFLSIVAGLALLRVRGLHVAKTMRAELAEGRVPASPIIDTFCLMAAGCLFIFPGFVSDALALLLIIPGIRRPLGAIVTRSMQARGFQGQTVHFRAASGEAGPVRWTCTTYGTGGTGTPGSGGLFPDREKRGNAVVIDCEPEDTPYEGQDDNGGPSGTADKPS